MKPSTSRRRPSSFKARRGSSSRTSAGAGQPQASRRPRPPRRDGVELDRAAAALEARPGSRPGSAARRRRPAPAGRTGASPFPDTPAAPPSARPASAILPSMSKRGWRSPPPASFTATVRSGAELAGRRAGTARRRSRLRPARGRRASGPRCGRSRRRTGRCGPVVGVTRRDEELLRRAGPRRPSRARSAARRRGRAAGASEPSGAVGTRISARPTRVSVKRTSPREQRRQRDLGLDETRATSEGASAPAGAEPQAVDGAAAATAAGGRRSAPRSATGVPAAREIAASIALALRLPVDEGRQRRAPPRARGSGGPRGRSGCRAGRAPSAVLDALGADVEREPSGA